MGLRIRNFVGLCLLFIFAAFGIAGTPVSIQAQENGTEPFTTLAGPYRIEVRAVPSNLSLGRVIFAVTVLNAATGQPVADAYVVVKVKPASDATANWGWGVALPSTYIPGRYDAEINLEAPGVWSVNVEVFTPLGQVSVDAPPVTVPTSRRNFNQGSIVFLGISLVSVLGVLYVWWNVRRGQRKRAAQLPSEESQQDNERGG